MHNLIKTGRKRNKELHYVRDTIRLGKLVNCKSRFLSEHVSPPQYIVVSFEYVYYM